MLNLSHFYATKDMSRLISHNLWCLFIYLLQGRTNPGRQVAVATKFWTVACNLFDILCGICFLSPFFLLSGFKVSTKCVSFWNTMIGSWLFRYRPATANGHEQTRFAVRWALYPFRLLKCIGAVDRNQKGVGMDWQTGLTLRPKNIVWIRKTN